MSTTDALGKIVRMPWVARLRHTRGFTLIELMMVVAIIAILAMVALQYGGNFTQEEQLRELSRAVVGGLSQARAEAVRRGTKVMVYFGPTEIDAFIDGNGNYLYDISEKLLWSYKYDNTKYNIKAGGATLLTSGNPAGALTAVFDYQGYLWTANNVPMSPVLCVRAPALVDVRAVSITMAGTARIAIYGDGKQLCP